MAYTGKDPLILLIPQKKNSPPPFWGEWTELPAHGHFIQSVPPIPPSHLSLLVLGGTGGGGGIRSGGGCGGVGGYDGAH
jgi:hypothetical protein